MCDTIICATTMNRQNIYQSPELRVMRLSTVEHLLVESQQQQPTADFMKNPGVSSDCIVKEERTSGSSVWDNDWSKQ